jgi:uncharacterized surface anchored protein
MLDPGEGSHPSARGTWPWWLRPLALVPAAAAVASLSAMSLPVVAGTLTVTTNDSVSQRSLAGTTFRVQLPDGTVEVPQLTTDSTGTARTSLLAGQTYCLVETAVPAGYLQVPTFSPGQCVLLTTTQPSATIAVTDPPAGALEVVTTDQSGTAVTLPGARFKVHQGSPTGSVVATLITDGSGSATATLAAGLTYCVEETAAPPGFQVAPAYAPAACVPVTAGATSVVSAADPPVPVPTSPSSTPTTAPPGAVTGEVEVIKTDPGGQVVTTPGFRFDVSAGTTSGHLIAIITTDGSGTAITAGLRPARYCVAEISAPDGYRVEPTYSPSACVTVTADPIHGRHPTTIRVADATSAAQSPSASTVGPGGAAEQPTPGAAGRTPAAPTRAAPLGVLWKALAGLSVPRALAGSSAWEALVGFSVLVQAIGLTMVAVALRRRRRAAKADRDLAAHIRYDSTIS